MPGVVQKVSLVGFSHPHLTINRLKMFVFPSETSFIAADLLDYICC